MFKCGNYLYLSLPAVAVGGASKQAEDNVLIRDCTRGARVSTKGCIRAMKYLVKISHNQLKPRCQCNVQDQCQELCSICNALFWIVLKVWFKTKNVNVIEVVYMYVSSIYVIYYSRQYVEYAVYILYCTIHIYIYCICVCIYIYILYCTIYIVYILYCTIYICLCVCI